MVQAVLRDVSLSLTLFGFACAAPTQTDASTDTLTSSSTADVTAFDCDVLADDCQITHKCLPAQTGHIAVISEGGFASWCSELAYEAAGVGEPCTVNLNAHGDPNAAYDDCGAGLICWGVSDASVGRCERLCVGTKEEPLCPEKHFCAQGPGLNGVVCVQNCDPLEPACPPRDACNLMSEQWGCYPRDEASKGDARWGCSYQNDCAESFTCIPETSFQGCSNSHGACCAPLCDISASGSDAKCADVLPASACVPWPPGGGLPGHDDVGACLPAM